MSPKRKEALGKFLINFVLLILGTGVLSKVFSPEKLNGTQVILALLVALVSLTIGLYLYPKE